MVNSTVQSAGRVMGLCDNVCGDTGTIEITSVPGCMIAPPADSAYAVEPVGVDNITPSERAAVTN